MYYFQRLKSKTTRGMTKLNTAFYILQIIYYLYKMGLTGIDSRRKISNQQSIVQFGSLKLKYTTFLNDNSMSKSARIAEGTAVLRSLFSQELMAA